MVAHLLLVGVLASAPPPQLGQAVAILMPTSGPVVSVLADITINSDVVGDVVALGGSVRLGAGARVHGDVVVLGGSVAGDGAIEGRTVTAGDGWLLGGAGLPASGSRRAELGAALVRIGAWVALGSLLLVFLPGKVRLVAVEAQERPLRTVLVGVLSLAVWLAVAMLALLVVSTPIGAVFLLLAIVGFLVAKAVGVVAVAWLVGRSLRPLLPARWRGEVIRTSLALGALTAASLLPVIGEPLWVLLSIGGIGAFCAVCFQWRPFQALLPHLALR
jgi:hypothetical protein